MPPPRFGITDRPGDIVDRSGQWLAEQLGWRWVKSRRDVEVRAGRQVRRLGLQSSTWNRAGVATRVSTRVTVLDEALRAWREAHPASTVLPVSAYSVWPHVYNTLLVNIDLDLAEVECSGLPQRFTVLKTMRLEEFAAAFRERVLPVLELFQSPSLVARELPASWLSMVTSDTIEWALAHDDRDAAALLLRRHLERPLQGQQRWEQRLASFRRGWEIAPGRDGLPSSAGLVYHTESLGWLAQVHDLIDQETLRRQRRSRHNQRLSAAITTSPRIKSLSGASSPGFTGVRAAGQAACVYSGEPGRTAVNCNPNCDLGFRPRPRGWPNWGLSADQPIWVSWSARCRLTMYAVVRPESGR